MAAGGGERQQSPNLQIGLDTGFAKSPNVQVFGNSSLLGSYPHRKLAQAQNPSPGFIDMSHPGVRTRVLHLVRLSGGGRDPEKLSR